MSTPPRRRAAQTTTPLGTLQDSLTEVRSSYRAAADLLDGYVHESHFLRDDDSPDNHIVWASDGFTSIFGCPYSEYNRTKAWGGFYHRDEVQAAIERAHALRRGESVGAEIRIVRTNGDVRWLLVKNRPIFNARTQRVVGMLGIGQDITQRKAAEQNLRALEREIISIANREQQRIAHDLHDGLGQDLSGVALMLRSIADRHSAVSTALSTSLEETIRLVNRSIQEARTLARGLSPLGTGYGGLLGALHALAAHARDTTGLDVRFDRPQELVWTRSLSGADDDLYRIAAEAVHNALRHSGAKSIRISLRTHFGGLLLRVSDDGCGIPGHCPADAGMGMRIMDYRARMIGGRLSVRTRPNGGTRIMCSLPVLPDGVSAGR